MADYMYDATTITTITKNVFSRALKVHPNTTEAALLLKTSLYSTLKVLTLISSLQSGNDVQICTALNALFRLPSKWVKDTDRSIKNLPSEFSFDHLRIFVDDIIQTSDKWLTLFPVLGPNSNFYLYREKRDIMQMKMLLEDVRSTPDPTFLVQILDVILGQLYPLENAIKMKRKVHLLVTEMLEAL
jgi:hypothetical protein